MGMLRFVGFGLAAVLAAALVAAFALGLRLTPGLERDFDPDSAREMAAGYSAEIVRDEWGVPRIIGVSDADAAFGLAYAHAEDDFETIQASLRAGLGAGMIAANEEEARTSYLVQLLRIREDVEAGYETELSQEARAFAEGYAAGLNLYAANHPGERVSRDLFPVTGQDVVALSSFFSPLFYGFGDTVAEIMAPQAERDPAQGQALQVFLQEGSNVALGSNAFAIAPSRSADGATRLIVNSHQPTDGALAWYESHLISGEGLNFAGGLFPGAPVLHLGTNPDLGYAATVNYPDLIDVYALTVSEDGDSYELDGEMRDFDRRTARMTVRLFGPFGWQVTRPADWSAHGPVLHADHGSFAVRHATMGDIRFGEQAFAMMKARSLDEFENALEMGAMGNTNRIVADRHGRIARFYVARMPDRLPDAGVDWTGILPGDRSELIWEDFAPVSALPHMIDPEAGYVLDANHSPFEVTLGADDPDPADYPAEFGIETNMTNRALRATSLLAGDLDGRTTQGELIQIKYDDAYDEESLAAQLRDAIASTPFEDAAVREAAERAGAWTLSASRENRGAGLVLMTYYMTEGEDVLAEVETAFPLAVDWLTAHHGRIDPEWGEINRLIRGEVNLPLDGGPDTLRAVYGDPQEDGTLRMVAGDGLTYFVEWREDGTQSVLATHQYGASNRPDADHYTTQMEMFASEGLRPVPMSEAAVRRAAVEIYRPGDE
jgi:penicillin amidase/acyl-homoserine-lactone acylase